MRTQKIKANCNNRQCFEFDDLPGTAINNINESLKNLFSFSNSVAINRLLYKASRAAVKYNWQLSLVDIILSSGF